MKYKTILLIIPIFAFSLPLVSHAQTGIFIKNEIERLLNSVNTSVSTGGNYASGGTVNNGQAQVHSSVQTTINGETVTDIKIDRNSNEGEVKVEINSEVEADNDQIRTREEVRVNDQVEEIKEEVRSNGNRNHPQPAQTPSTVTQTQTPENLISENQTDTPIESTTVTTTETDTNSNINPPSEATSSSLNIIERIDIDRMREDIKNRVEPIISRITERINNLLQYFQNRFNINK